MPGFDGTGPRGMGPMTGGGRGFCSPWGVGAGFRAGIAAPFARVSYPWYRGGYGAYGGGIPYTSSIPYAGNWGMPYGAAATPGAVPFAPQMTKEQELDFLRNQAETIGEQLEQIEARIRDLTSEKG